jgi:hypothetical protein
MGQFKLSQQESHEAMIRGHLISLELRNYKEANGRYPASLDSLTLSEAITRDFKYSMNSEGYKMGYSGQRYTTAVRKWSGELK